MDKEKAAKKYNSIVKENLSNDFKNYKDPDQVFSEAVTPITCITNKKKHSILVNMSSDGLCSISKLKALGYEGDAFKEKYTLFREGMFDCLIWPSHAISINQLRSNKSTFNDRVDLTLIDIQKFYEIIKGKKDLSVDLVNALVSKEDGCKLASAYLNVKTFLWLCSFKDFNNFIEQRELQAFVKEKENKFEAKKWTKDSSCLFDKDYFNELCARVSEYKNNKKIRKTLDKDIKN